MNFDDAHFLVRCLRYYRFHTERPALKTLSLLDLNGATVVDVGANKGIYSFWLARAVGPSGKVHAFEPQPEMVRYIHDRKKGFGLGNVATWEAALSDHHGDAQLTRQRAGDGSASLCQDRNKSGDQLISVPLAALDDFELPNVSLLRASRLLKRRERQSPERCGRASSFLSTAPELSKRFRRLLRGTGSELR